MTATGHAAGKRSAELVTARLGLFREVLLRHERLDELEDGFRLVYPPGVIGDETLGELREAWPQLEFEIVPSTADEDEVTDLQITGPPGTKEAWLPLFELDASAFRERSFAALVLGWRARLLTSPLRVLPDFIIIGTSKAGTTTLFSDILQHPRVVAPGQKELFYFDRDFARGTWRYRANFPTILTRSIRRAVTGEASPTYLEHPQVPQRVRGLVPNVRLIAILRDPVDRAYSLHHLKTQTGAETLTLDEAIDREERELKGELDRVAANDRYFSPLLHHAAYVWGGRYADHLRRWTQVFPREQLLVLSNHELRTCRDETIGRVQDFLGLPRQPLEQQVDSNRSIYNPMETATRSRLREIFRPHNEQLWEFLGVDWGWNDRGQA